RGAGVIIVPVGLAAGEAFAGAMCAWTVVRGLGYRVAPNLDRPPALRELARLLAAEVGGAAISRVNPVIDQPVAGLSPIVGAGTLLRYANDVAFVPTSLLQAVLLSVLLSRLSEHGAAGDLAAVRAVVRRTVWTIVPILAAAAGMLFVVRVP